MTLRELQKEARIASEKIVKKYNDKINDETLDPSAIEAEMIKTIDDMQENKNILDYIDNARKTARNELAKLELSKNTVSILLGEEIE